MLTNTLKVIVGVITALVLYLVGEYVFGQPSAGMHPILGIGVLVVCFIVYCETDKR